MVSRWIAQQQPTKKKRKFFTLKNPLPYYLATPFIILTDFIISLSFITVTKKKSEINLNYNSLLFYEAIKLTM